jgi:hypothetical protein
MPGRCSKFPVGVTYNLERNVKILGWMAYSSTLKMEAVCSSGRSSKLRGYEALRPVIKAVGAVEHKQLTRLKVANTAELR